jgi:hypothetical protein
MCEDRREENVGTSDVIHNYHPLFSVSGPKPREPVNLPRLARSPSAYFRNMTRRRTITSLVASLPEAARTTAVHGGKSFIQLLAEGEGPCLQKLDGIVTAPDVGGKDAWKWTMAKKVHHALRKAGLGVDETGITPSGHNVKTSSPKTKAARAKAAAAEISGAKKGGVLKDLFASNGEGGDDEEDGGEEAASEEEDKSDEDAGSGDDGDRDGEARRDVDEDVDTGRGEADSGNSDGGNEVPPEEVDKSADRGGDDDSDEDRRPAKRGRLFVPERTAPRKASAGAKRATVTDRRQAAAWLESVKALT